MQDSVAMAYFKTNLKQLMLKKSVELDHPINRSEIAEATGLSLPTISRWYNGKVDSVESETAARLMGYFQCTFSELIEIVP